MGDLLTELMNSGVVITFIVGGLVYLLNKLYAKVPLAKQFEGPAITAVKMAEKMIPDDTKNKSLKKLDHALKYMDKVFEEYAKRPATPPEKLELRNAVEKAHSDLDKTPMSK